MAGHDAERVAVVAARLAGDFSGVPVPARFRVSVAGHLRAGTADDAPAGINTAEIKLDGHRVGLDAAQMHVRADRQLGSDRKLAVVVRLHLVDADLAPPVAQLSFPAGEGPGGGIVVFAEV